MIFFAILGIFVSLRGHEFPRLSVIGANIWVVNILLEGVAWLRL